MSSDDNMFALNVNQIRNKYKKKCQTRTYIYKQILEKCYYRISACVDKEENFCVFHIPPFQIGTPLYKLPYCAAYIIYHLKQNGYTVKFLNPNILFITWTYDDSKYILDDSGKNPLDEIDVYIGSKPPMKTLDAPKTKNTQNTSYRPVSDYKPTGQFIHL